ncbi:hypothetical protein JWG39_15300 [Desulforhopalus vacuolatus]|uniref:hypothetical protein n=1 Tax=Desulforhopalus vacuolatus TaxID=40414 RepID=UPI00196443CA|nr:hypothetical protein [Desulforhopalus vacuolatus]MBM9521186.1 hypothetical protein [Desulforhopalus vacuolatus]
MKKYNRLLSLSLLGISPFLFQGTALAESTAFDPDTPSMGDYTKNPVYISSGAKPVVMLLLDTSGSMRYLAYNQNATNNLEYDRKDVDDYTETCKAKCTADEKFAEYGYFDPDSNYTDEMENPGNAYGREKLFKRDSGGTSGRVLNCIYMRRMDIARKVLTGGSAVTTKDGDSALEITYPKNPNANENSYSKVQVVVEEEDGEVSGIIQSFANDVRFGLTTFDTTGEAVGGTVTDPIGSLTDDIIYNINHAIAYGGTPLAESLWTIIGYFQQSLTDHSAYQQDGAYTVSNSSDPYYNSAQEETIDCVPAYVITLTDGAPMADDILPSSAITTDESTDIIDGTYYDDVSWYAHYTDLRPDGAADDKEIDEDQTLDIYNIFTFGTEDDDDVAMKLMNASSQNGGTDSAYDASSGEAIVKALGEILGDITTNATTGTSVSVIQGSQDGSGATFQASYFPEKESEEDATSITWTGDVQALFIDSAGNLREDTVHDNQLDPTEDRIYEIYTADDGTVRAKLSLDEDGDGVLSDDETTFSTAAIDEVAYLWSASDWLNNSTLAPTTQRSYSGTTKERFITTWIDSDNDGVIDAGERKYFTTDVLGKDAFYGYFLGSGITNLDLNGDGSVDLTDLNNLINYIRGEEITGMRSRTLNGTTYRLGDIIDSTPTAVQTPSDNFDTRFNSTTYRKFKLAYADRRTMVYTGGNDGLFHAFNGGFFQSSYTPTDETTPITNKFWLNRVISGDTVSYNDTGLDLGAEMWAYAPYNLLPHLQWLTREDYEHIYYNDLKPKVFAAKLWEEDDVHVGGWGTLLIGGMKWGGGPITVDVNAGTSEDEDNRTMRSAYFVFDITNPELEPVLLSEFTLDDDDRFSFANVYPSVIPVKSDADSDDPESWFLALGNGPTNLKGESDQVGKFIVRQFKTDLDMGQGLSETGDLWEGIGASTTTTTTTDEGTTEETTTQSPEVYFPITDEDDVSILNSFISNPYTVDLQQGVVTGAFTADATYFGTISGSFPEDENYSGTWSGKMYRVVIEDLADLITTTPSDPNTWEKSVFYDAGAPISTAPVMGMDD